MLYPVERRGRMYVQSSAPASGHRGRHQSTTKALGQNGEAVAAYTGALAAGTRSGLARSDREKAPSEMRTVRSLRGTCILDQAFAANMVRTRCN
jgi:hypothetical protein